MYREGRLSLILRNTEGPLQVKEDQLVVDSRYQETRVYRVEEKGLALVKEFESKGHTLVVNEDSVVIWDYKEGLLRYELGTGLSSVLMKLKGLTHYYYVSGVALNYPLVALSNDYGIVAIINSLTGEEYLRFRGGRVSRLHDQPYGYQHPHLVFHKNRLYFFFSGGRSAGASSGGFSVWLLEQKKKPEELKNKLLKRITAPIHHSASFLLSSDLVVTCDRNDRTLLTLWNLEKDSSRSFRVDKEYVGGAGIPRTNLLVLLTKRLTVQVWDWKKEVLVKEAGNPITDDDSRYKFPIDNYFLFLEGKVLVGSGYYNLPSSNKDLSLDFVPSTWTIRLHQVPLYRTRIHYCALKTKLHSLPNDLVREVWNFL